MRRCHSRKGRPTSQQARIAQTTKQSSPSGTTAVVAHRSQDQQGPARRGPPPCSTKSSWNVEPQPPEIIGPWFLWKLLIDERHQGRGYGFEVVRQIAELVRSEGATDLLTSYVPENGGPAGFYERLGFAPTGGLDPDGEVIMRLVLPWRQSASPPSSE
jgi:RimJ/RimL family protein N-acetyltransferase